MPRPVVIPARFCGPPDRGNGGVTAGLLAAHLDGPVQVTLRQPSPLDTPLAVVRDGDTVVLRDGNAVIAEAIETIVEVGPPAAISLDAARAAAAASPVVLHPEWHPFASCFVCGPGRAIATGCVSIPAASTLASCTPPRCRFRRSSPTQPASCRRSSSGRPSTARAAS